MPSSKRRPSKSKPDAGQPARAAAPSAPLPASDGRDVTARATGLSRRDVAHAAVATLALFLVYAATACRTFHDGDSAEIAAAVATFGVAHPPGYPLFTLLTGVAVHALPLGPAFAANLVTAGWGALAMGGLWLLARRLGASVTAAWVGALSAGLGATWWAQCVAAEVYTFDGLLLVLVLHGALGLGPQRRQALLLGVLGGLWLGHRPLNVAYLPAVLVIAATSGVVDRTRWPRAALGAALSGVAYLYLPLASARHPALDVGEPDDWERFFTVVRAAPYGRHWFAGGLDGAASRVAAYLSALPRETGVAWLLAIAGGYALADARGRRTVAALATMVATCVAIGATYGILDVEVVFIPASLMLALLAAPGTDVVIRRWPRAGAWLLVAASAVLLPMNFAGNDLRDASLARTLAEDTLASTPENGLLIVAGDTAVHGLWYLQAVEHSRPDVIVFSPGHVTSWYVDELEQRYPSEHWPAWEPSADASAYTRAVIRTHVGSRPVLATQSVDLARYLGGPDGASLTVIPHGLLHELVERSARVDVGDAATLTARLASAGVDHVGALPGDLRSDDASTVLGYALGAVSAADWLAHVGRREAARGLYRQVLALRPDELEEPVRRDARRELGAAPPELDLEARARAAVARLDLPPATPGDPRPP